LNRVIDTTDTTETTSPSADDQNDTTDTTETTSPSADDQNDTTDTTGATDTTDKIKLWDLINFSFGFPAVVTFIIFGIHQPFDEINFKPNSIDKLEIKYKYINYYFFIYFMVSTIIFISLFLLNRQNKLQYNRLFKTNFFLLVSLMKFLIVDLYHNSKAMERFFKKKQVKINKTLK